MSVGSCFSNAFVIGLVLNFETKISTSRGFVIPFNFFTKSSVASTPTFLRSVPISLGTFDLAICLNTPLATFSDTPIAPSGSNASPNSSLTLPSLKSMFFFTGGIKAYSAYFLSINLSILSLISSSDFPSRERRE